MFVTLDVEANLGTVRLALQGDVGARDRLFGETYGRVLRYLRRLAAGNFALAEDLAQESMVRIIRSFGQLREPERFVPWAFRIATNVWRDHHRPKIISTLPVSPETPTGGRTEEREDLAQRVLDGLARLPESYRIVLTLRYLESMEYEAMAQVLETPVPTLRSQIARGRQMVRRMMGEWR